jgi:hypothetical protein
MLGQELIQGERARLGRQERLASIIAGGHHLLSREAVQPVRIDFLAHGRGEPLRCIGLERYDFPAPVPDRGTLRPAVHLEQVNQHETQIALDRIEMRQAHVVDLLDNVFPVHLVHPLAARDAAQQVGLVPGPGENVAIVEIVWHGERGAVCGGAAPSHFRLKPWTAGGCTVACAVARVAWMPAARD